MCLSVSCRWCFPWTAPAGMEEEVSAVHLEWLLVQARCSTEECEEKAFLMLTSEQWGQRGPGPLPLPPACILQAWFAQRAPKPTFLARDLVLFCLVLFFSQKRENPTDLINIFILECWGFNPSPWSWAAWADKASELNQRGLNRDSAPY